MGQNPCRRPSSGIAVKAPLYEASCTLWMSTCVRSTHAVIDLSPVPVVSSKHQPNSTTRVANHAHAAARRPPGPGRGLHRCS
jgi:hypothetical protein